MEEGKRNERKRCGTEGGKHEAWMRLRYFFYDRDHVEPLEKLAETNMEVVGQLNDAHTVCRGNPNVS